MLRCFYTIFRVHLLVQTIKMHGMYIKITSVTRVFYNTKLVDYSKFDKNSNSTVTHGNNWQEHNNAVTNVHSHTKQLGHVKG